MRKALLCIAAVMITIPIMARNKEQICITCEDGNKLKILVYHPETVAESPATGVLWIHGGGYITGMASMAGMMGMGPILVKNHGCVVISPEYRLGKKGRYPNAMNAAWGGQWDNNEIMISMGSHATTENLNERGEFTVAFATKDTLVSPQTTSG